jgi:pyruvate dehydrogenase E2 component (dihydrolipoamide acetyltransferase)
MALREFKLPDPGEGLLEAEIVEWKVAVGDTVKVNDIVVEVETSKSLVELPIPWAGTVAGLHVTVGDEVEVGTVIITIDDGTGGAAPAADVGEPATGEAGVPDEDAAVEEEPVKTLVGYGPKATSSSRRPRKSSAAAPASTPASADPGPVATASADTAVAPAASRTDAQTRALAKPPVRKLAKDLGVDINTVTGSGEGGVVTRADVEAYAAGSPSAVGGTTAAPGNNAAASASTGAGTTAASRNNAGERETRVPIKGVRKMTAQAMVGSAFTAPHVTEWVTLDVTATMELVERLKGDREFRDVKVTPMLVLAKAMLVAIKRNPEINAAWDEAAQEIVLKHYVNLGIAAATPRGLIVPNIKDADQLTMRDLADAIAALTATARDGRTSPSDMAGGTMTITNIGVFGIDAGTPILNPGESAILAFGTIARRPWVVGKGADERIEPRWVTTLALSFDHRLVDGELGSKFLADVAAILGDPSRGLVWG